MVTLVCRGRTNNNVAIDGVKISDRPKDCAINAQDQPTREAIQVPIVMVMETIEATSVK